MALLTVTHVAKSYPGLPVLHDISFGVEEGDILCLLGPSGCGKTTLLHIIAGLEAPDAGQVTLGGQDLAQVPVHRRHFGLMFQDYALFPHQDVYQNVAFGLRMQRRPPDEVLRRVREVLDLVELAGYERRRVTDLSGGEQQRVALARSLAPRPRLLMLDEPLGALDRTLREQLMNEVRAIIKRVGVTAIYVTHDQEEAFAVADRILIMRARPDLGQGGHVEQAGAPAEIYRHPATPFVARFLGFHNLLPARVLGDRRALGCMVETALGPLEAGDASPALAKGQEVILLIRPEAAALRPASAGGQNTVPGRLLGASFRGSRFLIRTGHAGDVELICEVPATGTDLPATGDALALWLDPAALSILPANP